MTTVRLVGPGRAGRSLAAALAEVGINVDGLLGRNDPLARAAQGTDALILAVPDDAVHEVAASIEPVAGTVVMHLSGSLTLDVLDPHLCRASMHPLVPLPDPEVGAKRLLSGVTFAVSGDPIALHLASALGGRVIAVSDVDRSAYHAAACVAANHVVALMGQVERLAGLAGLPLDAFVGLARAALDDVESLGPAAALTGPARRGDEATLERHRAVLRFLGPADEQAYESGVELARLLAQPASQVDSHPDPHSKVPA